jgi:hypothetical protein
MGTRLWVLVASLICFSAGAAEVAGIKFDETTQVSGAALKLNGAGLRKRVFFQVYAMGLYLPEKKTAGADILALAGPKRVAIRMLRDVDAETFTQALIDGMQPNHSEAEMKALEPRIAQLSAIMAGLKEAKTGMAISLDWTGSETRVLIEGKPSGRAIAGEDFHRALLRIWVGDQPVQDDLKKALLGG